MKYEDPEMEVIELVPREVFMTVSDPLANGGKDDNGDGFTPVEGEEDW